MCLLSVWFVLSYSVLEMTNPSISPFSSSSASRPGSFPGSSGVTNPGASFPSSTEEIACRSGLALRSCLRTKPESETIIADLGWYIRRSDDTRTRLGRLGVLAPITWQPLSEMIPSLPKISIAGNAKRSRSPSESDFIPDSKSLTGVTECSKSSGSYDSKCAEICEDTWQEAESRVPTSICFSIASTSGGEHALCPF